MGLGGPRKLEVKAEPPPEKGLFGGAGESQKEALISGVRDIHNKKVQKLKYIKDNKKVVE